MNKVISNAMCTGCTACASICPAKAITMKELSDGFKYPVINEKKCIHCDLCKKTCPVINTKKNNSLNKCYVGFNKDEHIREMSSSGGIFSVFSNYVLKCSGIVIGASFDENNKLKHIAITKVENMEKLQSSKYLQSDLERVFQFVKNCLLKDDKIILFSGTPCQIAGLKSYLKKDYDNLICMDVICHGVPTPKLFEKYIDELEKNNNAKLIKYDFRDKCTGWENYSNTAIFNSGRILSNKASENSYMKLFLSDIALRESCYNCNFKLGNKYSDITLGDFWGVKKCYPEMYNEKGASCIIVNTLKGMNVFDEIKSEIEYEDCSLENILKGNPSLKFSGKMPEKREQFFAELNNMNNNFSFLAKKFEKKEGGINKLKRKCKSILNKIIK